MDRKAKRSLFGLPLFAGLCAIAAAFAGIASISDRSSATRVDPKAQLRLSAGDAAAKVNAARPAAEDARPGTIPAGGAIRTRVRCAGCGVVESVRRIDRRETANNFYSFADSDRLLAKGNAHDGGEYSGVATLADTVDGVLAVRPGAKGMKLTSSYQIVIRFRDGSRRVLNEATPRTLQRGEHVLVIASVNLPAE